MKNDRSYFPFFFDISNRRILVVGAGQIALRRIQTLLAFDGQIEVAADKVCKEILELTEGGLLKLHPGMFREEMLEGFDIVLACTDNQEQNTRIYKKCRELGIWVNNCSDQRECDFFFPSVVKQKELVIGINAAGTNHRLVKETRERIEQIMGGNDADYNRN